MLRCSNTGAPCVGSESKMRKHITFTTYFVRQRYVRLSGTDKGGCSLVDKFPACVAQPSLRRLVANEDFVSANLTTCTTFCLGPHSSDWSGLLSPRDNISSGGASPSRGTNFKNLDSLMAQRSKCTWSRDGRPTGKSASLIRMEMVVRFRYEKTIFGGLAKKLRPGSAKPVYVGATPTSTSTFWAGMFR